MNKAPKKNDAPSCACGKGDLYEEWLKAENKKKKSEATVSDMAEDSENPSNSADKED